MNRFRGRSGAGNAPAHGLAPQNFSPDKRVDVCADSDEDRGSTPLASSLRSQRSGEQRLPRRSLGESGPFSFTTLTLRATTRQASELNAPVQYVYVLQSESDPRRFYTGHTHDLRERLTRHNCGKVRYTAKWRPWRIKTYIAFSDLKQAIESNAT